MTHHINSPASVQSITPEPNSWIAAAATGDGVLCVYVNTDPDTVSVWDMKEEQGPTLDIPVTAIPSVIRMLQDALRAYGREVS